jgi:anti-anti-sigma factor
MSFVVSTQNFGDVAVVRLEGYLNNVVGEKLEKECIKCMDKGISAIVLDFDKVEFINSIGVSIVLSIIERLRESGGKLLFSSLRSVHKETFDMLGLTKYARAFGSEGEALKSLGMEAGK